MRLWTLHPKYLDPKGLVALWREALLAQAVLLGRTKGYRHHPQLHRFLACPRPAAALASYLAAVHTEATGRGYRFDATKIGRARLGARLPETRGQLLYEWAHLRQKLLLRDAGHWRAMAAVTAPSPHPLFRLTRGGVRPWEKTAAAPVVFRLRGRAGRPTLAGASRSMPLSIVHYNDPVLRKKGARVTAFDAGLAALGAEMTEAMHTAEGIGLAAQQIGRALQLCVVDLRAAKAESGWELDGARPPLELLMPLVLFNPAVTALPSAETLYEEGCLSFPGIRGEISRPDAIRVDFQDVHGVPHRLVCTGLFARCVQHEADHLNGVLFIDRMDRKTRAGIDDAVKALAKETRQPAAG